MWILAGAEPRWCVESEETFETFEPRGPRAAVALESPETACEAEGVAATQGIPAA